MYCRKCGNKLKENAKFCTKCGTSIITKEPVNYVQAMPEVVEEIIIPEEKIESKTSNTIILEIVFGTIILALGLIIGLSSF